MLLVALWAALPTPFPRPSRALPTPFPRPSHALPTPSPRPPHALPTPFPCPFSEIALLTDGVRVASVYAVTDVTCLVLDKASFTRLLGPCEDILKRNMTNYNLYLNQQA